MHADPFQLAQIIVQTVKIVFVRNDIDRHMDMRTVFPGKAYALGDIFDFKITGAGSQRKALAAQVHCVRTITDCRFQTSQIAGRS